MYELLPPRVRLLGAPHLVPKIAQRLAGDLRRPWVKQPRPLESYVRDAYGLDLSSEYGGLRARNPFGKASGQLSLAVHQIDKDAAAGLGFVVLKTLIAQDAQGAQSMHEWAIPETRMLVERIRGRSGAQGWTVTWKGRGWFDTFTAYLQLFSDALAVDPQMLIVPSVKYHLPTPEEHFWRKTEYEFTTRELLRIWRKYNAQLSMPLEKDFSPTLAGSSHAAQQAQVLEWISTVPRLLREVAGSELCIGLKLFNAMFEDAFQLELLRHVHCAPEQSRCDFIVYGNRLFDPQREFEGKKGVAFGGPDLSDRNLAVLENFLDHGAARGRVLPNEAVRRCKEQVRASAAAKRCPAAGDPAMREEPSQVKAAVPLSGTGDILSGRRAAEYLLRGASTFQMHTLFQLPASEFVADTGTKTERGLQRLLFDPEDGFIAWMLHLRSRFAWPEDFNVAAAARWCREHWEVVRQIAA